MTPSKSAGGAAPPTWVVIGVGLAVLLLLVLVVGIRVNGSRRWLGFGSLRLQVSEFAKLGLIFAMAHFLSRPTDELRSVPLFWKAIGMIVLPFLLINGPAMQKMGIENGGQMISKGANPALGRALGLIIKNIAGYKLGRNYMATFGYPMNFVIAENAGESPWQPYHVEHGFKKEDSTVTACGTVTWGWPPAIYGTPDKTAAQTALEFLSIEITKKPCLARLAERGPKGFRNMITIMIAPPVAKSLADEGYSKDCIREYLYEHARVPFRELDYDRVIQWLTAILGLDPAGQYPLLLASQVYLQVPDPERQRRMSAFVYEQFLRAPNERWRWLAHVSIMAKHRLHDDALALRSPTARRLIWLAARR